MLILFSLGLVLLWPKFHLKEKITDIDIQLVGPKTLGESFILQNLQIEKDILYEATAIDIDPKFDFNWFC